MLRIFSLIFALQFSINYGFRIQPRIVNGDISQQFQFRSYIYLQSIPNPGEKVSSCGGTLISNRYVLNVILYLFLQLRQFDFNRCNNFLFPPLPLILLRWVLTAAHCLENQRDVFVLGGIDKYGKFYGRERVNTSNQHIHPKYDAITLANDIGKKPDAWTITFNNNCLTRPFFFYPKH